MSFEIQELPDVIKIIILLSVHRGVEVNKSLLKRRVDKYCAGYVCVEKEDFEKALKEIAQEGLIYNSDGKIALTSKGLNFPKNGKVFS